MSTQDPFGVCDRMDVGIESSMVYRLDRIPEVDPATLDKRPYTIRIILENLLRNASRTQVPLRTVQALARGESAAALELPFFPARVLLQDFTGIPVLVDLTALRSAAADRGTPAGSVNPTVPVDLVVDHSVQVDSFASPKSLFINIDREYGRNGERYRLLKWAQSSFDRLRIVPPGNGIVHQVNLEFLASVVSRDERGGMFEAFPDTLVGTDSHTTMVNGLGVLGWGVGGIEAEAVMLGEPSYIPTPSVVGVELTGTLPEGATATDLVLTVTRKLREHGVVDRFVEFYGRGLDSLAVPDRATISNMCPEYGATAALFPIDAATLRYLRSTGRDESTVARVAAYARLQRLWHDARTPTPHYAERIVIDLAKVVPTISGPRNPEDSVPLRQVPESFRTALAEYRSEHAAKPPTNGGVGVQDGAVVIAAITSCTNTSNPSVMVGAGLIAQRAVALGLKVPPWVKTSLAPGSKVVTAYLERAGLLQPLAELGFEVVGYGCTTCIGNSGPLPPEVERAVREDDLFVAAVLSGNRNFDGRIHNQLRASYLASPMLVVAYALAGRMDVDLASDPIGTGTNGEPVRLRDLWPKLSEVHEIVDASIDADLFREKYRSITVGDTHWEELPTETGDLYPWDPESTYLRRPPYFELAPPVAPTGSRLIEGARALLLLDDRVTTDHISPAGAIPEPSPAGAYLKEHGVAVADFNTYGTRRGNHEVMIRGTFANVRLKNQLAPGTEGGWTVHQPSGETMTVFDAAVRYRSQSVPLVVLAGSAYGQGSSRDWAAKGPMLLGVRAVVAKSFERIHRSNLVGMGVLPLQFPEGVGWRELGISGKETFELDLPGGASLSPQARLDLLIRSTEGTEGRVPVICRVDSPEELEYLRLGGLLPYVLERLVARGSPQPASGAGSTADRPTKG